MKFFLRYLCAVTLCSAIALPAAAQFDQANQTKGKSNPDATAAQAGASNMHKVENRKDRIFMEKAAEGGLLEVQLGQLAQEKAQDAPVKEFGKRMVDDHSKANDQLKTIAASKGVSLPTTLPASQKAKIDKLNKLSGAQFDHQYMKMMVADHKADVAEFKKESQSGSDPDVKAFAGQTLPTLQDHLKMAQDTEAKVSGNTGGTKGTVNSAEKGAKKKTGGKQ